MLVARAELADEHVRDVRVDAEDVVEVAERLTPRPGEHVIDARGMAVVPGLHDHHVHLRALAATSASVDLRDVRDVASFGRALRDAVARRPPGAWLRVVGYHESIAGPLDRWALDRLAPVGTPVRVQHRSGALWVLNSAALAEARLVTTDEPGVDTASGHVLRRDDLLRSLSALDGTQLAAVGAAAAAKGVTGFTDATPNGTSDHARDLARDLRAAGVAQDLHLMGPPGAEPPDAPRASLGPVKILLDDHDLPSPDDLVSTIRAAHEDRRPVAIHCVTRVQLILATTALESAGTADGDRIEHASVVPPELIESLARLRLTVVTQPHFIGERGDDYRRDVDPDDLASLYRVRSLLEAGVRVAAGTDAPFGVADPWASIAAATERCTRAGHVLGTDERVDTTTALAMYLGHADAPGAVRTIAPGRAADLCVLAVPRRALVADPRDVEVRATVIAGQLVHGG